MQWKQRGSTMAPWKNWPRLTCLTPPLPVELMGWQLSLTRNSPATIGTSPNGEGAWAAPDFAPIPVAARLVVEDFLGERSVYLRNDPSEWPIALRRNNIGQGIRPWFEPMFVKVKSDLQEGSGVRFRGLKTFRATFAQVAKDRGPRSKQSRGRCATKRRRPRSVITPASGQTVPSQKSSEVSGAPSRCNPVQPGRQPEENAPVGIRTRAPGSTGRDHRPLDHRGSGRRQSPWANYAFWG